MVCWLRAHEWGWPRRREGHDVQVCVRCGARRTSVIQFKGNGRQAADATERPSHHEAEATAALQA
jgi:hypothetical protein